MSVLAQMPYASGIHGEKHASSISWNKILNGVRISERTAELKDTKVFHAQTPVT